MSVANIIDKISALAEGNKKESEFVCFVCKNKYLRTLDKEWEYLAFNATFPTDYNRTQEIGIVWTCSPECKTTYCLQKI